MPNSPVIDICLFFLALALADIIVKKAEKTPDTILQREYSSSFANCMFAPGGFRYRRQDR